MNLDFSKCKSKEDVDKVFRESGFGNVVKLLKKGAKDVEKQLEDKK